MLEMLSWTTASASLLHFLPQDWAKLSSCEPSLASTLQRRRGSVDKMRDLEAPPSPQGYSGMQPDDPHRARIGPGNIAAKVRRRQKNVCVSL